MAIVTFLLSTWAPAALLVAAVAYYVYPYLVTYRHLQWIPAPFPAQFTNWWLLLVCRRGYRYETVDKLHKKLGPVVRIQPNHVSLCDDEAIQVVYGHGNGFFKAYRAEHSRKRKIVSRTFSVKSVAQFEPYIHSNLELFVRQLDSLISRSNNPDGAAYLDCLNWFNYLTFDVIGDLAFGAPFGMLSSGADMAEVRSSPDSPPIYAPAIEILNRRGEVSATLGVLPQLKPYAKYFPDPFFSKGLQAVENLAGIAIARVKARLENPLPAQRKDLLQRLIEGRDEKGEPLGRQELTAEALTQLIAGSGTTSNSSCALLFHAVRTPGVIPKLQAELDAAILPTWTCPRSTWSATCRTSRPSSTRRSASTRPRASACPDRCPRTARGCTTRATTFRPAPSSACRHTRSITPRRFGARMRTEFRPERWESLTPRQKNAFIPFSYGPRACVGRNVAEMEMKLIVATWARRYEVFLRQDSMNTREGFLRKPLGLEIGLKRRH
ncbi:cytochrome P450 [Parathielavia appendiculata]|uniref:Cytochrome P450 n=1 Tax=Parathielavia appendiculata TaxID=2587402 RepID=A0AAN6Z9A6_9PEZI|nr:cytochrome P450 [Parathielavia appendiculata]